MLNHSEKIRNCSMHTTNAFVWGFPGCVCARAYTISLLFFVFSQTWFDRLFINRIHAPRLVSRTPHGTTVWHLVRTLLQGSLEGCPGHKLFRRCRDLPVRIMLIDHHCASCPRLLVMCRVPELQGQLREEALAREFEKQRADELQAQQDKEAAQNELVRACRSLPELAG